MTSNELHARAYAIARNIKSNYIEMFDVLRLIEERQIFLGFDVTSLKVYYVELLQLSPSIAKDLTTVVKKSIEIPELVDAIRSGKTSIYRARKVCPVLTSDNCLEWIDLITSDCTVRVVEKCVAMAKPREAVQESMTYVAGDILEFKVAVDEEWEALLQETKDLMSQKLNLAVNSEDALRHLMKQYCEKESPVRKAQRAFSSAANTIKNKAAKAKREADQVTRYRTAKVEHAVNLRDQWQCTYIHETGKRCQAKRWLHKHHIVEFADSGQHTLENLVTLCGAHHRAIHGRHVTHRFANAAASRTASPRR